MILLVFSTQDRKWAEVDSLCITSCQYYHIRQNTMLKLVPILLLALSIHSQGIWMVTEEATQQIAKGQYRADMFYQSSPELDCGMPRLFVLEDRSHTSYSIRSEGILISSASGKWSPIDASFMCDETSCNVLIENQCSAQSSPINWVRLETSIGEIEYLVNCNPDEYYKPFEIGLLLLIVLCSVVVTLSAINSRAWSYGDYGYEIRKRDVLVFNFVVLLGMVAGYVYPSVVSVAAQVLGSVLGAIGVTVCVSESLWLVNYRNFRIKVFKMVRLLDIVSISVGLIFIPLYWLLNGQWIVNDIMAICTIVALMKLLKLRSLAMTIFLTGSLLFLESAVGLFIHYVLKVSYNNYIINIFQNPNILVMPSITPQLYRQCAWLPITSILFPGLLLSYLRRLDVSRSTNIYLKVGLWSFYLGSATWLAVDQVIRHSLPFGVISEPVAIAVICLVSLKRNELKIIWKGIFYDQQFTESGHLSFGQKQIQIQNAGNQFVDLTSNLRLTKSLQDSQDNYKVLEEKQ